MAQSFTPIQAPYRPQGTGMSPWLERALPWLASGTFHLGLFLIAAFILYAASKTLHNDAEDQIVIPTSFTDPSLSSTPGQRAPGEAGDPDRDAAQENMKNVLKTDGWAQTGSAQSMAGLLEGQSAQTDIDLIARGNGGSIGTGAAGAGESSGGPMAPYGTPGGGAAGFKTSFYGTGGSATRLVYIIDHSGSMLDNFDYLKQETKRSVNNLMPLQLFSVIMVAETASIVGPPQLHRATKEAKQDFIGTLDNYVAEGQNDDLLPPFQEAFEKAFAMKPQLVYFLTDGHFDPQLIEVVRKLNEGRKVHINTLAFVNHDPSYEGQLQELAKTNGGVYRFVSEKDAQGR